jgi:hypothetical protein
MGPGAVIVSQRCRRAVTQNEGSVERPIAAKHRAGRRPAGLEPVRAEADPIVRLRSCLDHRVPLLKGTQSAIRFDKT